MPTSSGNKSKGGSSDGGGRRLNPLPAFLDAKSRSPRLRAKNKSPKTLKECVAHAASKTPAGQRFYDLVNRTTGERISGFRVKDDAKTGRNRLNEDEGGEDWRLSHGPDYPR